MKKTSFLKISVPIFSFVIALSFIFPCFALTLAQNSKNLDYDLSRQGFAGDTYNDYISSSELIESEFELSLSSAEKSYLDTYGRIKIIYPKSIPTSYVTYSHSDNTLTVRATAYSYLNPAGKTVIWIPNSVSLSSGGSTDFIKSGEDYLAEIPLADFSDELSIELDYVTSVTIPSSAVNELLGKAFSDGKYYYEANAVYLSAYQKYLSDKAQYDIDLPIYTAALADYNSKYVLYRKYLSDKKVYDEKLSQYKAYLLAVEEYKAAQQLYLDYEAAMEKYKAEYQLYLESEAKREALADEILAYEQYLADKEKADYRLGLVESLKTTVTELNRSLYGAITGDTVSAVIENEDIIAGNLVGADRGAVQMAGNATTWLRTLYDGYFSKESLEDKYNYYRHNYRRFRDNTVNLFRALDNLYQNQRVKDILAANEKDEKYRILLAQLYLASLAYSDVDIYTYDGTGVYDSTYRISSPTGDLTAREIVCDEGYYLDRNFAEPAKDDLYPSPVEMPDYTPVPKPIQPREVKAPTEPEKVDEPTEPILVAEPTAPTKPIEPKMPEKPYGDGSIEEKIAEAYSRSELTKREELFISGDLMLDVAAKMTKSFSSTVVEVNYFDDCKTLIGTVSVDKGSFAEIDYIPQKSEDAEASYIFSAWVDEYGNEVDLNGVYTDLSVYPKFEKVPKKYNVKWHIGETTAISEVLYGEIPVFDGAVMLPETPSVSYEFLGWSLDGINVLTPAAVSGHVDYYAVFKPHYTVAVGDSFATVEVAESGEVSVYLDSYLSVRAGVSKLIKEAEGQICFKLKGVSLTVPYSELLVLKSSDAKELAIDFSSADGCAEFFADFYSASDERLQTPIKLSVAVEKKFSGSDLQLFSVGTDEKQYFRFTENETNFDFYLNTGTRLRLAKENKISLFPNELIALSTNISVASPGEIVNISVQIPDGIKVTGYYYVTSSGEQISFPDGSFVMPEQSVTVGVFAERSEYEVVFISDGIVIAKHKYYYGESLVLPSEPTKAESEEYRYVFIGWSPEPQLTVISDATYTALFESETLEKDDDKGGLKISESVMRKIVALSIFAVLILVAFVPALSITGVYFGRFKRFFIHKGKTKPKN